MIGADQPQMDLSPLDSVTVIALLHLMAPNAPLYQPNVQTLASLDSIVARLTSCHGDRLIPRL